MSDFIALHRNENFQSLFEEGGLLWETRDHLLRQLKNKELSPYEQGKAQGQLYALERLPALIEAAAKRQEKDAMEADRKRAETKPGPRFLRSVP